MVIIEAGQAHAGYTGQQVLTMEVLALVMAVVVVIVVRVGQVERRIRDTRGVNPVCRGKRAACVLLAVCFQLCNSWHFSAPTRLLLHSNNGIQRPLPRYEQAYGGWDGWVEG